MNLSGEGRWRGGARSRGGRFRAKPWFERVNGQVVEQPEKKAARLKHWGEA